MQDAPSAAELVEAVREFLEQEVAPGQTDRRARFRTLVAINALAIAQRELESGEALAREELDSLALLLDARLDPGPPRERLLELNRELCARIRRGEAPPGTLAHLRRVGAAKLRVASPRYLERYEA